MIRYMLSHRKIKKLLLILIAYLVLLTIYNQLSSYITNYDSLIDKLQSNQLKSVQLLTNRFDYINWKLGHGLGLEPFKNCPEKRCYAFKPFLFQRPCEKADGVMVHGLNLLHMPSRTSYKRNSKQLWLYYTLESQGRSHCSTHYEMTDLDDWFNITATFKLDSDLVADYREFRHWKDIENNKKYFNKFTVQLTQYKDPTETITDISNKNEFIDKRYQQKPVYKRATILWIVSHCETMSRREDYVKELQKYIYVDIFGQCGNDRDPCQREKNKSYRDECLNELYNSYKFYLSFENCLCDDYATEKYWQFYDSNRIFKVNTIPIVRGAKESYFKRMAQPNSYINAQNFKSPKDLADYLIYLNENNTAYLEYFNWKVNLYKRLMNKYETNPTDLIIDNWNVSTEYHLREPFCKMCSLLHNNTYMNSKSNRVWKLSDWFGKNTNCWDKEEPRYLVEKFVKFFGFCI